MQLGFLNLAMLAGLAAVSIPLLIHLLHRRRYQVVDWGAMQFLQVSETTRRRLMLEEFLLMALRMGLIALLVLALAAPFAVGGWLGALGGRPNRDVVIILDGSSSMSFTAGDKPTPFDKAKEWADAFLMEMAAGDRVALLLARQPPEWIVPELTEDAGYLRDEIRRLPSPRGVPDWPRALGDALDTLKSASPSARHEVILVTDQRRFGWADSETVEAWRRLADRIFWAKDQTVSPRLRLVDVAKDLPAVTSNWSLPPLTSGRALAGVGQRLKVSGAIKLDGQAAFSPPHRFYFEIDGKRADDIELPASAAASGQVPFSFHHRFTSAGTHLVSVIVEPDPPKNERPPGYVARDVLPADNRQDLAVEVVRELPVLLVDGGPFSLPGENAGKEPAKASAASTFFLEKALGGPADAEQPALVVPRVTSHVDFTPEMLRAAPVGGHDPPRVVFLVDVPLLTPEQGEAIEKYLEEGGRVLIALGPRMAAERERWNERFYRQGAGWLPAKLESIEGEEKKAEYAVAPDPKRFQHPALEIFQSDSQGAFRKTRFPRWWRVSTPNAGRSTPVALLTSGDPFLVERGYQKSPSGGLKPTLPASEGGRVLLCTVPLDRSWGANFPGEWEFPVLVHELTYHLAQARSGAINVPPGRPASLSTQAFAADGLSRPARLAVTIPDGAAATSDVNGWPWTFAKTGRLGGYRVSSAEGHVAWFAVQGDPRESDLTPCDADDRARVARLLSLSEGDAVSSGDGDTDGRRQDLWWLFMIGVTLLLCMEVWWTRRMALARGV